MKMHFIAGWGGFPLIGSKEQIVEGLAKLSGLGLDGVVVSWPRYIEDMRTFQREIAAAVAAGRAAIAAAPSAVIPGRPCSQVYAACVNSGSRHPSRL